MSYSGERFRIGLGPAMTPAVKYLIFANLGIFILQNIFGREVELLFGLRPAMLIYKFAIWQLVTYMFLHGGVLHVLINMFVLWMFGADLERHWGSKQFLKYYFICGIGAGVVQVLVTVSFFPSNMAIPVVGASGAIYGLLLAFALLFPNREIFLLLFFVLPVRLKAKYLAMIFGGLALFSGLFGSNSEVANFAHLGGMLVGFLYLKVDWRFEALTAWLKRQKGSREIVRQARHRQKEIRLRESVDEILDKINEVGIENLTDEEKAILHRASRYLSKEEES